MADLLSLQRRLRFNLVEARNNWRLFQLTRKIAAKAHLSIEEPPVVFFNASTRLTGMSLNSAFALLAACGVQLAGAPVIYFGCRSGMSHCVLGTNRGDYTKPPPCQGCIAQSERMFAHAPTEWFTFRRSPDLDAALEDLNVPALTEFAWRLPDPDGRLPVVPLGSLVTPSLRWALRVHKLPDDEPTRYLFREYIQSAYQVAVSFRDLLLRVDPQCVVVFNGLMYPEASARWVTQQFGVRVITHEVAFKPQSAFFSERHATAYPIEIPEEFELDDEQKARLDKYLSGRFQGKFTMAGIRFWPDMQRLGEAFERKAAGFNQIVPVFTNVVYDTSQVHANVLFPHMFAWLDQILEIIRAHPDTLFVIRAHPDEMRPGTGKQSRESVQDWVKRNQVDRLPNIIFINPVEYLSSYELIQKAKFVMVYNSSIGLEATLMGVPVLCGGKARFTQYPMVFFPDSVEAFRRQADMFLAQPSGIELPEGFQRNARRFLYYQLEKASLPFGDFIEPHPRPGYVKLRSFSWEDLKPPPQGISQADTIRSDNTIRSNDTIRVLIDGILHGGNFLRGEN